MNTDAFIAAWNNHKIPTARIADALGVSRAAVSRRAHNMGLPTREKVRRKKHDPALLAEMWMAGVSAKEIAEYFGMAHHACASTAARKQGLPKRERGSAGYRNGGWKGNLPIGLFWQEKMAARWAEEVKQGKAGRRGA